MKSTADQNNHQDEYFTQRLQKQKRKSLQSEVEIQTEITNLAQPLNETDIARRQEAYQELVAKRRDEELKMIKQMKRDQSKFIHPNPMFNRRIEVAQLELDRKHAQEDDKLR